MNYTSIEQSKHLLELGLKPESADMWYHYANCFKDPRNNKYPTFKNMFDNDVPCWSAGALLELMPKTINWKFLDIFSNGEDFCIEYNNPNGESLTFHQNESLVEVCYETMCWLLQNNHIKTE